MRGPETALLSGMWGNGHIPVTPLQGEFLLLNSYEAVATGQGLGLLGSWS